MAILVTGADGFLGKEVMASLQSAHHDTVGITKCSSSRPNYLVADLSVVENILRVLNEVNPSAIVNLAATVDFSPNTLSKLYPVNVLLPAILSSWCSEHGCYLLQASSIIVQGYHNVFFSLNVPEEPDTDYGVSKFLAEKVIWASGCESAIIRFGGLFGRKGPSHLGLNNAIRLAADGIPPTVSGKGLARRNYLYVADAALIIKHCVENRLDGIHMAGGEVCSIAEMLGMVCDVYLKGPKPLYIDGQEAKDQIIQTTPGLPSCRGFLQALKDDQ